MTADLGELIGTTPGVIVRHYPQLYHMAEADAWESIQRHGLLSTSALLDLFEITGERREVIESQHRPESVRISHPVQGKAVIRDQKALRDGDLEKCLTDISPQRWYEALNSRVFFWATEDRLLRLLNAKEYRDRPHCVLVVDSTRLIGEYSDRTVLSPLNSGCTRPIAWPRGSRTFLALGDYPFNFRRKQYGVKNAVAELAINYGVPNIAQMIVRVDLMHGSTVRRTLFRQ